ncbi:rRNA pseudouridine synthase [Listeria aquatica]|uniref:Pseudouridine synthase n=1 Tax=Listeria aquatica TaxID=1494960 RepID=A0A841ZPV3_9LIST|nr:pseudouridine synthase [Listeria aquatica]MBC1521482.1 rRNA pseudouridine synthase [Listeria aquatica]
MRLDKLLANMGIGTRKEVKGILKKGNVWVNGKQVKDGGLQVTPESDEVVVNGNMVQFSEFSYWMLNKPQGVVSATEDKVDRTVMDLFKPEDRRKGLFPVGRLDKDTEGLLLITNDGALSHQLLSPKKHVDKVYFVKVTGELTKEDQIAFENGVVFLDGYKALPAKLEILAAGEALVTIREGKFHQVKKMFEACGKKVTYLKREKMASLELDESLPLGAYRPLTKQELDLLFASQI